MEKTKIDSALKRKYIIPCFQREYSWEKDEIEELINDIIDNKDYCIGIVTVKKANEDILLIDGQQRITTLYLIAIACGKIKSANDIMLISEYEKLANKENDLANLIKGKYKNIPKRLIEAYDCIKEKLAEKLNQGQNKWDAFKNSYYYEINLDKSIDINHYFEVMNSRGIQLSRSDIVKSILIQHLSNDDDKYRLNNLWYIYEKMIDDKNKYKTFNSFKKDKIEDKTINEILNKNKVDKDNISKKDNNNEMDDKSILNFDYFLLYVIRLYKNREEKEYKNSGEFDLNDLTKEYKEYFNNKDSKEVLNFLNFLVDMKNIYDKYIVKYDDTSEDWNLEVKDEDMKLIQSCLRVSFTNRKLMHWLYLTLKYFYDENNKDEIKKYNKTMRNYIKNEYIRKFIDEAKEKKYKTGFNTPNIVLNYLDFLIKENSNYVYNIIPEAKGLKYKNFKFKFRNSIEHFEPRHGENENQEWLDDFGNLALLAYKTNTKIQNASPKEKVEHFKNNLSDYSLKLQIMAKITLSKEWNEGNMKKFRNVMIELLEDDLKK